MAEFTAPDGYGLVLLDQVDSTNSEAARLLASGATDPTWIVAKEQLAGRGRRGRDWASTPGNLYSSLLLFTDRSLGDAATLSFVVALALRDAIVDISQDLAERVTLKWPNDVLVDGKKVAGILLESGNKIEAGAHPVIIGCGVNCTHHPASTRYPATNLAAAGAIRQPFELFNVYAANFDRWYNKWAAKDGFDNVRTSWLNHAAGKGKPITARFGTSEIEGRFETLDEKGRLILVDSNNKKIPITAGDIFFSGADKPPQSSTSR